MTRLGCVDVGGTEIKSALLDGHELRDVRRDPTPGSGPDVAAAVLDAIVAAAGHLAAAGPLDALGVVVPGIVDTARGYALWSGNLGWRDVPIRDALTARLGIPVAFGHDVGAGALAEAQLGAGADHRDVAFLAIGTGIAAGLVLDGVAFDRDRPTGEVGHLDVGSGLPCPCGLTGCLETVSSAAAIGRRYAERTGRPADARDVADRLGAGDAAAEQVWADAVAGLAHTVAWLAGTLAPEVVVIGGGLARAGELLLGPLRSEVDRRLSFHHRPSLVASRFGGLAGTAGAGLLARQLVADR